MIKGILLDFYGTVVEDDEAIMDEIAGQVAAKASARTTGREVREAWDNECINAAEAPGFRTLRECARLSLATVMAEVGCIADAEALCQRQYAYWRTPPLRPNTREFLANVTVPICIVSDIDRADIDAALAHHGLAFTAVVTSQDAGAYKPDRAMFAKALAALRLNPDEVIHVGDSIGADVYGAHNAGIKAVWVNRHGLIAPEGAPIGHEIADLAGLTPLLPAAN